MAICCREKNSLENQVMFGWHLNSSEKYKVFMGILFVFNLSLLLLNFILI